MAKLIKVRFHEFGGNDTLRVDRLEQSGPDAGQILVSVRGEGGWSREVTQRELKISTT